MNIDQSTKIGDITKGQVAIHSSNVHQQLAEQATDASVKELNALFDALRSELLRIPQERKEDRERLEQALNLVVSESTRDRKNQGFLQSSLESLKKATDVVADAIPSAIGLVANIWNIATKLFGIS
jgi:hypothetical protein